jgi:hypothetical protein
VNRGARSGDKGVWATNARSVGIGVMGRAIAIISGSAGAWLPRPFAGFGHFLTAFWHDIAYHPELHYMRGPGPAWRAKHGQRPD